jgi:hypothetical protein
MSERSWNTAWNTASKSDLREALERADFLNAEQREALTLAHHTERGLRAEIDGHVRDKEVWRQSATRLREALREVAACGVSFEDERIGYVEVQIDRSTWERVKALGDTPDE